VKWPIPIFRRKPKVEFVEPGPLIDHDLELVEPAMRWVDAMMHTIDHPASQGDRTTHATREDIMRMVEQFPRGRETGDGRGSRVPMYTFWMRLRPGQTTGTDIEMAGSISLRIGDTNDLRMYLGHIGYGVFPPARGRHLAERSCRLLLPLARAMGLRQLWITNNPDNWASRRTCERLGATLVEVVDLPKGHPLYERGDRQKCRYLLPLDSAL
jgi:predicted acetyltransferase